MSFTTPIALLLLLSLPFIVWLGWPHAGRLRRRRWRDQGSVALRILILLLLILSLAGLQIVRSADDLAVVFLVDASDSISQEQAAQAEAYVRSAMSLMGPNDQAAVILFGANALVDRPHERLGRTGPHHHCATNIANGFSGSHPPGAGPVSGRQRSSPGAVERWAAHHWR
ncbi:MAG: VWA domain-containing protein [Chloroflexi bacterium]|nr:VWA domain-containing protein [Chloroflexota bacterium]